MLRCDMHAFSLFLSHARSLALYIFIYTNEYNEQKMEKTMMMKKKSSIFMLVYMQRFLVVVLWETQQHWH